MILSAANPPRRGQRTNAGATAQRARIFPRGTTLKALLDMHFNGVMLGDVIGPRMLEGASHFLALCCARTN